MLQAVVGIVAEVGMQTLSCRTDCSPWILKNYKFMQRL